MAINSTTSNDSTNKISQDSLLAAFLELTRQKKEIETKYEKARKEIIELHDSLKLTDSSRYDVKVSEIERTQVAGVTEIEDRSPKVHEALMKLGLIRSVKQTRLKVTEKI